MSFHRDIARLLLLCKMLRPYIYTVVAFLATRVKYPTDKDWKKLVRVLEYLKGTPEEFLTL